MASFCVQGDVKLSDDIIGVQCDVMHYDDIILCVVL